MFSKRTKRKMNNVNVCVKAKEGIASNAWLEKLYFFHPLSHNINAGYMAGVTGAVFLVVVVNNNSNNNNNNNNKAIRQERFKGSGNQGQKWCQWL